MIGEQDDGRLEPGLLLDRVGLRGDIALHRAFLVGEERLRVEGIGFYLFLGETVFGFQPLEIAGDAFLGHEQRQRLEILQFCHFGFRMRQKHLRVLLEHRGDGDHRHIVATASNDCSVFALMKKSSLPAISSVRLFTLGPPGTMVTSRP